MFVRDDDYEADVDDLHALESKSRSRFGPPWGVDSPLTRESLAAKNPAASASCLRFFHWVRTTQASSRPDCRLLLRTPHVLAA